MRLLALAFLFCLPSVVNAQAFQYMHPSLCDKVEVILDSIINNYGEKPVWSGEDIRDGSGYMMFENIKEKSWTLIKYNKEVACVLGVGAASRSMFGISV
jgi:hypothetical protein